MHRGYIYAKIPQLPSFYKYLYPEICRCPKLSSIFATLPRDYGDSASPTRTKLDAAISGIFSVKKYPGYHSL